MKTVPVAITLRTDPQLGKGLETLRVAAGLSQLGRLDLNLFVAPEDLDLNTLLSTPEAQPGPLQNYLRVLQQGTFTLFQKTASTCASPPGVRLRIVSAQHWEHEKNSIQRHLTI